MGVEWLQDEPVLEYEPIEMVCFISLFEGSDSVNLLDGSRLEKGGIQDARCAWAFALQRKGRS